MIAIRKRLGVAAIALATAATTFGVAGVAAAAGPTSIRCNIGRWGFDPCSGDNVTVPPGKKVYIELNSSGGKPVRFQVRNKAGGHMLLKEGPWQNQNEDAYFMWRNDTNRPVTVDIFADAKDLTSVSAVADIQVR